MARVLVVDDEPRLGKLASEMLKKSRIFRPSTALVPITMNALNAEIQMVLMRCSREKPCV